MTSTPTHRSRVLVLLASLTLTLGSGCTAAKDIIGEPSKDDPLDGYSPYLSEAGTNTEMDFGAGQQGMLTRYANLQGENLKLRQAMEARDQTISKLQADLETERGRLDRETRERAQAQATADQLRLQLRALESQVLTLSIEKAEMDLTLTKLRIAQLKGQLDGSQGTAPVEASTPASPSIGRGRL